MCSMDKTENKGEIVIYTSKDGKVRLDVRLENDTIWLSTDKIACCLKKTGQTYTDISQKYIAIRN